MKKYIILCFCALFSQQLIGQGYSEFTLQENGLIYSDSTMQKLRGIVDLLNLQFKVCEEHPQFHSLYQGLGHGLVLEGKRAGLALKDMQKIKAKSFT